MFYSLGLVQIPLVQHWSLPCIGGGAGDLAELELIPREVPLALGSAGAVERL